MPLPNFFEILRVVSKTKKADGWKDRRMWPFYFFVRRTHMKLKQKKRSCVWVSRNESV